MGGISLHKEFLVTGNDSKPLNFNLPSMSLLFEVLIDAGCELNPIRLCRNLGDPTWEKDGKVLTSTEMFGKRYHEGCKCGLYDRIHWLEYIDIAEKFLKDNPKWDVDLGLNWSQKNHERAEKLLATFKEWLNSFDGNEFYMDDDWVAHV